MSGTMDHVNLTLKIESALLNALDFTSALDLLQRDYSKQYANGVGASQASQHWHDQRTLGVSATENLDLAGGLTNAFGVVLTFTKLRFILFFAAVANTNDVQVQRASSNGVPLFMAASGGIQLKPGALFLAAFQDTTAIAVTAGTGDLLTITNSAGSTSVTYDVVIIGTD